MPARVADVRYRKEIGQAECLQGLRMSDTDKISDKPASSKDARLSDISTLSDFLQKILEHRQIIRQFRMEGSDQNLVVFGRYNLSVDACKHADSLSD